MRLPRFNAKTQRRKGAKKIFRLSRFASLGLCVFALTLFTAHSALSASTNFSDVAAIFEKHCLDCHSAPDPEGKLLLESFDALMKGGETGPALVPRHSTDSLLVKLIEGRFEKEGKKKIMPPGKRKKLEPEEIASIRSWIDSGALPSSDVRPKELVIPKIIPKVSPRKPVTAVAAAPKQKLVAIARDDAVELQSFESRTALRTLSGHRGVVNAVAFSADGKQLFAGAGIVEGSDPEQEWNETELKMQGMLDAIARA